MSLSRNQFTLQTVFLLITTIAIVLSIIRNPSAAGVLTVVTLGLMAITIGFWGVQAVCSRDKVAVRLIGVVLVAISIGGSVFLIFGIQFLSAVLTGQNHR